MRRTTVCPVESLSILQVMLLSPWLEARQTKGQPRRVVNAAKAPYFSHAQRGENGEFGERGESDESGGAAAEAGGRREGRAPCSHADRTGQVRCGET